MEDLFNLRSEKVRETGGGGGTVTGGNTLKPSKQFVLNFGKRNISVADGDMTRRLVKLSLKTFSQLNEISSIEFIRFSAL